MSNDTDTTANPDVNSIPSSRSCEDCEQVFTPVGEEGLCTGCIDELFEDRHRPEAADIESHLAVG